MKRLLILLALSSLLISCQTSGPEAALPEVGSTVTAPILNEDTEEVIWEFEESSSRGDRYTSIITNPTSGAELITYLIVPEEAEAPYSTVMLVPGGVNSGTTSFLNDIDLINFFLKENIAVAFFDPDGRGMSTGEEDSNGHAGQDGLHAISQALMDSEFVDESEMGIISYSYGVTLASGMLARYAEDQPYEWFVDWEGPSSRSYTTVGCNDDDTQELRESCDDDEHWSEREAVNYLSEILIPYWRIQGIDDHVQPNNSHAIEAINAASNGLSPWTRINDEDPNQTFTMENEPEYIAKSSRVATLAAAMEFFETY